MEAGAGIMEGLELTALRIYQGPSFSVRSLGNAGSITVDIPQLAG